LIIAFHSPSPISFADDFRHYAFTYLPFSPFHFDITTPRFRRSIIADSLTLSDEGFQISRQKIFAIS
jgi:hypothetical protein